MSGGSFKSYGGDSSTFQGYARSHCSNDASEQERARRAREERLRKARREEELQQKQKRMEEERATREQERKSTFDASLIRNQITRPAAGIPRVHILAVDNSGSNRVIAAHIRKSAGYFNAFLKIVDPESQVAITYFSDHKDRDLMTQEIDFLTPGEESDKILYSTTQQVVGAHGHDFPEAIECVVHDLCDIDFNEASERHLYLITDAIPHGMPGFTEIGDDDGCPNQRTWGMVLPRVHQTFQSFAIVGCGDNPTILDFQEKMLNPERVAWDLIDLSGISNSKHRMGITVNAFLFLVARNLGEQAVELFLSMLYEKWLEEPIFGVDSDRQARLAISRFFKYLEMDETARERMKSRVIPD